MILAFVSIRIKPEKTITTIGPVVVMVGLVSGVFVWLVGFLYFVLLFCFESFPSIFTEGKVLLGWPPHTPRAFRSEIIWWNPCVLTPLPHNEALQSKPLSLFLTGVSLAAEGFLFVFLASPPHQWLTSTPNHWAWSDLSF